MVTTIDLLCIHQYMINMLHMLGPDLYNIQYRMQCKRVNTCKSYLATAEIDDLQLGRRQHVRYAFFGNSG